MPGILDAILLILGAIAAYVKYKFDPATIAKQDEINKQIAEDSGYASVDQILADGKTVSLSLFISEYLRRVRPEESADPTTRRAADILIGSLPRPRDQSDISKDNQEGF